jgi:multiple sugar transport system ATP-binding protein
MGAEFYAHFGAGSRHEFNSADLAELQEDAGGEVETTDQGESVIVARLAATSRARAHEPCELWIDATKMHFFEADSGAALTQH